MMSAYKSIGLLLIVFRRCYVVIAVEHLRAHRSARVKLKITALVVAMVMIIYGRVLSPIQSHICLLLESTSLLSWEDYIFSLSRISFRPLIAFLAIADEI